MANLIIRPASGAGNKVVVQDQSGAAVLTTADSGATIANATLVTPALGTPASGVMTNATGFPAGMMRHLYTLNDTTATTTLNVSIQQFSQQITITSGSKVMLEYLHHYEDNYNDASGNYFTFFFTGDTNSGLGATTSGTTFASAADHKQVYQTRNSVVGSRVVTPTITNPTYGVYLNQTGSANQADHYTSFTITEIFQ